MANALQLHQSCLSPAALACFHAARSSSRRSHGSRAATSRNLAPIDDTMFDLVLDGTGGVLGAIVGLRYIRGSRRGRELADSMRTLVSRI